MILKNMAYIFNIFFRKLYYLLLQFLEKTVKNVKNHKDIKLITTKAKKNQLVSEVRCHTTQIISDNLLAIEMKKTQILVNKQVYVGLSILENGQIAMYEFCHDYVKLKYGGKTKLCYMDADRFIVYIKTEGIYVDISKFVERKI